MERKQTQAEIRKERFDRQAQVARDLGDRALSAIDEALADEVELIEALNAAVEYGSLEPEEADFAITEYRRTRYGIQKDPE